MTKHDMSLFDANGGWGDPTYLGELYDDPIWVSRDKKKPKSPLDGQDVSVTKDQGRWGTYAQARKLNGGHVGIVLGPMGDDTYLCGIDIDGLLGDAVSHEIVKRFNTYTEVSPSGKGLHLLFMVSARDVATLGFNQKQFNKGDHCGITLDLDMRYYTVTEKVYGARTELRRVSLGDLQWLINEVGPRYVGTPTAVRTRDESGSGWGTRFLRNRYKNGDDYDAALIAIQADKGRAGDWVRRTDERQWRRAWK